MELFPVGQAVSIGVWDKYGDTGGQYRPIQVVVTAPHGQTTQVEGLYGPDWFDVEYVPGEEGGHTIVWFAPNGEPMACGGFEANLGA